MEYVIEELLTKRGRGRPPGEQQYLRLVDPPPFELIAVAPKLEPIAPPTPEPDEPDLLAVVDEEASLEQLASEGHTSRDHSDCVPPHMTSSSIFSSGEQNVFVSTG